MNSAAGAALVCSNLLVNALCHKDWAALNVTIAEIVAAPEAAAIITTTLAGVISNEARQLTKAIPGVYAGFEIADDAGQRIDVEAAHPLAVVYGRMYAATANRDWNGAEQLYLGFATAHGEVAAAHLLRALIDGAHTVAHGGE